MDWQAGSARVMGWNRARTSQFIYEFKLEIYHKVFGEEKDREEIYTQSNLRMCMKFSIRTASTWQLQLKPSRCEGRPVPSSVTYIGWMDDEANEFKNVALSKS